MKTIESLNLGKFHTLEKSQLSKILGGYACATPAGTATKAGTTFTYSADTYTKDDKTGDEGTAYHTTTDKSEAEPCKSSDN